MTRLSDLEIYKLTLKWFGDISEDAPVIAGAIALAESGGEVSAVGDNYPRWQTASSPYRWDQGLMQINSVHGYDGVKLINDADYNVECGRLIYDRQGFGAWSTYSGAGLPTGAAKPYEQYLPRMNAAKAQYDEEHTLVTGSGISISAEDLQAHIDAAFERGKQAGRSEVFFAGWLRDTVPQLRAIADAATAVAVMADEHADWVENRPGEWFIRAMEE